MMRLRAPDSAYTFSNRKGETKLIESLGVALHGRSYPAREPPADFLQSYPPRREGFLNIGLLHTSLNGAPGHDPYAPCTVDDLRRFGYDVTRQAGSHIRLETQTAPIHHLTVPNHSPLKVGTLHGILKDIAGHHKLTVEQLLERLDL